MLAQTWHVAKHHESEAFWDRLEESSNDVGLPCGLSDIGRELDIWPSAVQKWRDRINFPGKKNLIALAKARGVNTEWLLSGQGPKLAEGSMNEATRELMQIWNKLPKEAQDRLLKAARYEKITNSEPPASGVNPAPEPTSSAPRKAR